MARMIPSLGPADATSASHEEDVYWALSLLPDDFTVIHSFKTCKIGRSGSAEEREADFVVFNKDLGILCVEVKAGRIRCVNGEWEYQNGIPMRHGGPYRQADSMKWAILDRFASEGLGALAQRCRINHAVWLPTVDRGQLREIVGGPEAPREITLCRTDLNNPTVQLTRIMKIGNEAHRTHLTNEEAAEILGKILLPSFDIVPTRGASYAYSEFCFARLLESQKRVLDFLQDQKTAVINGAAGTGKTLIAIEYAKRHAVRDGVLFLCYNRLLRDDIAKRCEDVPNIEVYTISGYACKVTGRSEPDYSGLAGYLMQHLKSFPYKHIVIDEGQDFGQEAIESEMILDCFKAIVDGQDDASMYFFYDKRQFVQGSTMPGFILDADSKLTLYANCRNTQKIGQSSLNSLSEMMDKRVAFQGETGNTPKLYLSEDPVALARYVDGQIAGFRAAGLDDIVIITCKTLESSELSGYFSADGEKWRNSRVPVYTFRRYKGLEAEAVILIDVDESLWKKAEGPYDPEPGVVFYTASSRAKHELRVVGSMGEDGCRRSLENMGIAPTRRPRLKFKNVLGLDLVS